MRVALGITVALALLGRAGAPAARASDAPPASTPAPKPPPPQTLAQAADTALAALARKDNAALRILAGEHDPDPWLVADELIRRGDHDAAAAFANAAPRVDTEALPAYVESRRGQSDDPARRERLAKANESFAAGKSAEALEALGPEGPGPIDDLVGVRLAMGRGFALRSRAEPDASAAALLRAGEAAERLGWVARADLALYESGVSAYRGSRYLDAQAAWTRALAIRERRGDEAGVATTLGSLGSVHRALGEYATALSLQERALTAKEAVGDLIGAAVTLGNIGNIHEALGDRARALSAYNRALAAQEMLGDKSGAVRTLGHIGNVYLARGDYATALTFQERALAATEAVGDEVGSAWTLGRISLVYHSLGDYAKALSFGRRGVVALEALGDKSAAARTLGNLGVVHLDLGDFADALLIFERALAAQEALGDRSSAARTLGNIGLVHSRLGDFAKALSCLDRALAAQVALGDKVGVALSLGTMGSTHFRLGDSAKALATYERALAVQETISDRAGAVRTLGHIGNAHFVLGDGTKALSMYERVLAAQEAGGDKAGAAATTSNIGNVHRVLGHPAKALPFLERALAAKEALGDKSGAAQTLGTIGVVHGLLGDHAKALLFQERALTAAHALGDKALAAHRRGAIAAVHLRLGDYRKAVAFARDAVALIDTTSGGLGADESAGAREPFAVVFEVGARASLMAEDLDALTFFLEKGRAGALIEGLSVRDALWGTAVPATLRTAEVKVRAAELHAASAFRKAMERDDLADVRTKRAELEAAQEAVAGVVACIQREAKAGAAIVYPHAASLDEIRATLRAGEALVLYALLEEEAAALVIRSEGARLVPMGPRGLIDEAAEAVVAALEDPASDAIGALSALTALVVRPLAILEGVERVLVSPTGALSYVPFAALMPDKTIAYVPSGTTYRLLREDEGLRGTGVLALGDPDYATKIGDRALAVHRGGMGRLAPLPGTRKEVEAFGDVRLLGPAATEVGLKEALGGRARWRAVHLACHGLVDTERPALSSLAITASGEDDGFLTCLDVFRMKVPADLVVLSACETGRGRVVKSEGIVGLTRAFMFAGAPRVLCSLWKVDDAATAALMTRFYELWDPKDGTPGLPTAMALRQAQEHVRAQAKWRHPYYWAAWVLWGLPS